MAPMFNYQARSRSGEVISGTLEAKDSRDIVKQLKEKGYYVTNIDQKRESKDVGELFNINKKVKIRDLSVFSQQFSAMINAGIPLIDALNIMNEQASHPRLKEALSEVRDDVETGTDLSEALSNQPDVFPNLYCQMIRSGEASGTLDKVLIELSDHYERQDEIKGEVKSALTYPVVIIFIAIIVVVFLMIAVIPTFEEIFASLDASLPAITQYLINTSQFMQRNFLFILMGVALLAIIIFNYKKSVSGQLFFDKMMLRLPKIGSMMEKVYTSRMASTLSTLLESGVDLLSALNIVEDVIGNEVYARALTEARTQVREGIAFSRPLSESILFPSMLVQMIRVGEEAGSMEEMLKKVANIYQREVERSIDDTISIIEPVMIVFLAIIVGVIVIAIALPLFSIGGMV